LPGVLSFSLLAFPDMLSKPRCHRVSTMLGTSHSARLDLFVDICCKSQRLDLAKAWFGRFVAFTPRCC
jgi:hypothetical protein